MTAPPQSGGVGSPGTFALGDWAKIAARTIDRSTADDYGIVAASIAFAAFLSLLPLLSLVALSYGAIVPRAVVVGNIDTLVGILPDHAQAFVRHWLAHSMARHGRTFVTVLISALLTLFSARRVSTRRRCASRESIPTAKTIEQRSAEGPTYDFGHGRSKPFGQFSDRRYSHLMDLDDLLFRYFGTASLSDVGAAARSAGIERMLVDFGLSRDRGSRFALWSLLHIFGAAPDLDVAFPDPEDREAARDFMDLLASGQDQAQ